ncbi:hypothetical protein ACLMJK_003737 [Lecanora helva]
MMQALRFHGQKDIRLDQIEIPICGKGQVKVRPAYVGICGTDLHEYLGGANIMPTTPHPITNEKVPLTLGHEFSGVIEEIGDDVEDIEVGTRVTVQPIIYDGTCRASLVEPIAVAWHAVNISPFQKGDSALILGGGPIGLAVIQALKARGAGNIIVSEIAPRRKEFAKQFGADHVLDPTKDDVVVRVRELCDGYGVNVAYDAAGVQAGLDQAILALRARGTLVNIAIWEKTANITPNALCFREKKYMGVATYQEGDFQDVIDAIASGGSMVLSSKDPANDPWLGRLKPESMITAKIQMDEVEEKGFKALIHDKENHVKILVQVSP